MKKTVFGTTLFLLIVLAVPLSALAQSGPGAASGEGTPAVYLPGKTYSGIFASGRMYYRYPKTFWRGSNHPGYLKDVSCYQARVALEKFGLWTGALQPDGSCGNGDPVTWATGNYVNFWMSAPSNSN